MAINTGFKNPDGTDVTSTLIERSYLLDRYPELVDTFKQAGLWIWGESGIGQLGTNDSIHRSSPVQTVAGGTNWKQVSGGTYISAAIKTDGTLWMWGYNVYGQLGDNTTASKSSPVQTVSGGTNWKQVSTGTQTTSAIKTDGTLWLWGDNFAGQLGDNTIVVKSSPVQTVAAGTNWKQVACGDYSTAAIKTDGTLWVWGYNLVGQLGTNDLVHRSSPVQTVAGGTNWKQVSGGFQVFAAIKTDGTLWTWGYNPSGQLGTNDSIHRSSPVQTVAGGTNWKQVSCGSSSIMAAIKTDGTLWTWGSGSSGSLGDGTLVSKSSPVQTVAGGTNWKQVACGSGTTSAIKTDGTLWLWGVGTYGQLGDGTSLPKSSPVQTVAAGTNWKQVACGSSQTVAIRDDSADPI